MGVRQFAPPPGGRPSTKQTKEFRRKILHVALFLWGCSQSIPISENQKDSWEFLLSKALPRQTLEWALASEAVLHLPQFSESKGLQTLVDQGRIFAANLL